MARTAIAAIILLSLSAPAAAAQEVRVGVFLRNVESIDVENNSYYLHFLIWMKWKGPIDPTKTFRFTNLIDTWALTQTPVYETPITLEDGSSYQRFSVEGRFFHKFWLGAFPLDWQKVTLEVEDSQW